MELIDLMAFGSDLKLQLDDGTLPANSIVLGMFSSVFRAATEVHTAGASSGSSSSSSKTYTIPLEGLTKEQWLEVAGFLYPVTPQPVIKDWTQAEFLLEVATKYDLKLLLHKVDLYLQSQAGKMTQGAAADPSPGSSRVWKWLQAADKSGLAVCLPAIANQAVFVDRAGCNCNLNLSGLSSVACQAMIKALATVTVGYGVCPYAHTQCVA